MLTRLRIASEHPSGIDVFALIEKITFVETDLVRFGCRVRVKSSDAHLNIQRLLSFPIQSTRRKMNEPVDRRSRAAVARVATSDTKLCFRCPTDATNSREKLVFGSLRILNRRGSAVERRGEEETYWCFASLSTSVRNLEPTSLDRRSTDRNRPLNEEKRNPRLKRKSIRRGFFYLVRRSFLSMSNNSSLFHSVEDDLKERRMKSL